jgi:hypothetical protein
MRKPDKFTKTSLVGAALVICLCLPLILDAFSNGRGVVSSIRDGILERLEDSAWQQITAGREVSNGERLRTDETAVAVIDFPDIGKFVIGPSSDIELGKVIKDFNAKIDRGAMWFKSSLAKGNRASITTSIASAGIRGTAFSMVFGQGEKLICICTCSGQVEALTKSGKKIKVPKGKYLPVSLEGPAPVKAVTSLPLLEKKGSVFDFCFNCHVVGGQGKLKPDLK